jgi:RNA polymerase sigma-70 factor (ECF subfamily)
VDKRFEEIYKKHGKYVYNVALGILKNRQDAEDAAQNVFIKLAGSIDSFRGESDIKTYLYRMAVNNSIDYIRKQSTHREKIEKVQVHEYASASSSLILDSLLDQLDEDHSVPLLLSEVGGFKYGEIAKILNIKPGTVKSRINRAIMKLRETLKKEASK